MNESNLEIKKEDEKNIYLQEVLVLGPEEWDGKDGMQPILSLVGISR